MKTINDIIWNDEDDDITIQSIPINCLTISCGSIVPLEDNGPWICDPLPPLLDCSFCIVIP
ncbi:MAG: hypothetical protein PHY13_01200 [Clostridia bacterium]|nr:hypothetical protein [Clostridia bacterium]MDD4542374.1 hypothetical protein [Clostridia bacterium]